MLYRTRTHAHIYTCTCIVDARAAIRSAPMTNKYTCVTNAVLAQRSNSRGQSLDIHADMPEEGAQQAPSSTLAFGGHAALSGCRRRGRPPVCARLGSQPERRWEEDQGDRHLRSRQVVRGCVWQQQSQAMALCHPKEVGATLDVRDHAPASERSAGTPR